MTDPITPTPYSRAMTIVGKCEYDMKQITNRLNPFDSTYHADCQALQMTFDNWRQAYRLMVDIEEANG